MHTSIVYVGGAESILRSVIKDVCFILLVIWTIYVYKAGIYMSLRHAWIRKIGSIFILRCLVAVLYTIAIGSGMSSLLVGIKYTIRPVFLLVGGILLGYGIYCHTIIFPDQRIVFGLEDSNFRIKILTYIGIFLFVGLLLQLFKLWLPDLVSLGGYGPVGDYVLGSAPPLYYRTGPGGIMRLQGLFSGPNNYAYFLVGIFPLVSIVSILERKYHIRQKYFSSRLALVWILFLVSCMWTLSRSVIVGGGIQVLFLVMLYLPQYKKRLMQFSLGICVCFFLLSIYKRSSTIEHVYAWLDGFDAVIANIWGYGLGSSGPSVHRSGVYLPENTYLQYMLDTGVWGFLLLSGMVGYICKKIYTIVIPALGEQEYSHIYVSAYLGLLGLFVVGLFLHVFEDSMVNYLVLFPFSLIIGLVIASKSIKN